MLTLRVADLERAVVARPRPGLSFAWARVIYRAEGPQAWSEQYVASTDDNFDQFFVENYEAMVGALTVAFGDREAAAEAVQDAFIKAYARWSRIGRYDCPLAWVRRVAINRLRDHARKEKRRRQTEERAQAEPVKPHKLAESGSLVVLLSDLSERQRTAMALHYVEDVSVVGIAQSMGLSVGAVKAHLHKGRNRMRELYTDASALTLVSDGGEWS